MNPTLDVLSGKTCFFSFSFLFYWNRSVYQCLKPVLFVDVGAVVRDVGKHESQDVPQKLFGTWRVPNHQPCNYQQRLRLLPQKTTALNTCELNNNLPQKWTKKAISMIWSQQSAVPHHQSQTIPWSLSNGFVLFVASTIHTTFYNRPLHTVHSAHGQQHKGWCHPHRPKNSTGRV